jgi:carboxymethylenebutenolidase
MPEATITAKTPSKQHGASFKAFVAPPKGGGSAPGVVLIQEIFGVNENMRDTALSLSAEGYLVFCPDLFWRQGPGIQLTDQTEAEWARAFELYKGFDAKLGVEDLIATLDATRAHAQCSGKVGAVGYCLGGNLAYQMACKSSVDAAVGYYGVGIENILADAAGIRKPLMLHIAEKDQFCPPEAQAKIKAALGGNALVTIHSYPGQDHAFARAGGQHYHGPSADSANERTARFFRQHLM